MRKAFKSGFTVINKEAVSVTNDTVDKIYPRSVAIDKVIYMRTSFLAIQQMSNYAIGFTPLGPKILSGQIPSENLYLRKFKLEVKSAYYMVKRRVMFAC